MSGLFDYFKKAQTVTTETEINVVGACFTDKWARYSVLNLYNKIMHECADRAALPEGVDQDAFVSTVYDSYSPAKRGLISLVVVAMTEQKQYFYEKEKLSDGSYLFNLIDQAKAMKNGKIRHDVLELDFREFYEASILKLLYQLLSEINQALSNGVAVSRAMLVKLHALSEMIDNSQNREALNEQLAQLKTALAGGQMGYIDALSSVETVAVDTMPSKTASEYVHGMIAGVTGIPASYLFSDTVGGLGDMSNSEERRLNVAMKRYFNSILRGVLYAVFDQRFEYKFLIVDIDQMISLFSWIETTDLITDEAKAKVMVNNTIFNQGDMKTQLPADPDLVDQ